MNLFALYPQTMPVKMLSSYLLTMGRERWYAWQLIGIVNITRQNQLKEMS